MKSSFSSIGDDGIPGFLLHDCANILVVPLGILFNLILKTSIFPCKLKVGKVRPIFKTGDRSNITNYRPITILSSLSKVFETILYEYVYSYVENLISEHQHGFVNGRSTVTNLTTLSHFVAVALDSNTQVDVVYTDFSKAFDRIDHNILLDKLRSLGFSVSLVNLFQSYLSDRVSYVDVEGFHSSKFKINSGVPQGSNLGPLLFLLFINDIAEIFNSNALLFADDLKLFSTVSSESDCIQLQDNLDFLLNWCQNNNLDLNINKCRVLSFSRRAKPIQFNYCINNVPLQRCVSFRDLGVTFDSQFSFNTHIENITSSSLKTLGFIIRSCHHFESLICLKLLYNTLVRSKLEYCSSIWSPRYNKYIVAIEYVQRKFAKYLWFKDQHVYPIRGISNLTLNAEYNLTSLEDRRSICSLLFLYKLLHGLYNSPFLLSQINFAVPQANLRSFRFFHIPRANTNLLLKSPVFNMCSIFNTSCNRCDIFALSLREFFNYVRQTFSTGAPED